MPAASGTRQPAALWLAALSPAVALAHGKHVHGQGELLLVQDGNAVVIEATAPGADLVGFEREPRTPAEHAALQAVRDALERPATLFALATEADCRLTEQTRSDGFDGPQHAGDESRDGEAAADEPTDDHREFTVRLRFRCAQPTALSLDASGWFTTFPGSAELRLTALLATGDRTTTLSRRRPQFRP